MTHSTATINRKGTGKMNEDQMEQEMVWQHITVDWEADNKDRDQPAAYYPRTEAAMIRSAQQGDLDAFNQLVLVYQNSLYRWVCSLVRDEALADDITQMTFVTAYEKLTTFRGGSFQAWLFKIARNRSFDVLRYNKRRPAVSLDDEPLGEDGRGLLSILPDDQPSPEELLIESERAGWVRSMLNTLSEPFRQAVELVDLFEMDYEETAQVLGVPVGTIKSRVARARVKLRDQMVQSMQI